MIKKNKKQAGLPRIDERPHSFLSTWSIAIICLAAIVLSPTLIGAARSLKVHANNVKQWLPKNFEASEDYDWFIERFGVDEMVAISWPGCTLDNPDVLKFCNCEICFSSSRSVLVDARASGCEPRGVGMVLEIVSL